MKPKMIGVSGDPGCGIFISTDLKILHHKRGSSIIEFKLEELLPYLVARATRELSLPTTKLSGLRSYYEAKTPLSFRGISTSDLSFYDKREEIHVCFSDSDIKAILTYIKE